MKVMEKCIFIILLLVLVVVGFVGVIFEVYKMLQDFILFCFVKCDIVGDYDIFYDEYFFCYYYVIGILFFLFDDIVEFFEVWFVGDRNMS